MGCVQSYFKKAHNAGLSPSSTQGSEKASLDEKEIKAQEERDDVQAAEIVRDVATIDEGEVKNLQDKEGTRVSDVTNDSVLDATAGAVTAVEAGAVTVAEVKAADNSDTSAVESITEKNQTERVPDTDSEVAETRLALTNKSQESCNSGDRKGSENAGDMVISTYKTEVEGDSSDSLVKGKEDISSGVEIPKREGKSLTPSDELNEATILEEPTPEIDDFVVINKQAEEEEAIPNTEGNVVTGLPKLNSEVEHVNKENSFIREDNVNRILDEHQDKSVVSSTTESRPLSREIGQYESDFDKKAPVASVEEIAPSECENVASETVSEISGTYFAVESGKEAANIRLKSEDGEKFGKPEDSTIVAIPEEINRNSVEDHATYSSPVNSAEEALTSRPLNDASEAVETMKFVNVTGTPEICGEKVEEDSDGHSGIVQERIYSIPVSEDNDKISEAITQATQVSFNSGNGRNSISPVSVANEVTEETTKKFSTAEKFAGVLEERSPNAASEMIDESEQNITSTIVSDVYEKKTEGHSEIFPTGFSADGGELTENQTKHLGANITDASSPSKLLSAGDDAEPKEGTVIHIPQLIGEIDEDHTEIPKYLDNVEDSPLSVADEASKKQIRTQSHEKLLEETSLSRSLNVTEVHTTEHTDDLSPMKTEEKKPIISENSKTIEKDIVQPFLPQSSETTVARISTTTNNNILNGDDNVLATGKTEENREISPLSLDSGAVETPYEDHITSKSVEEAVLSRPLSMVSETGTEHTEKTPSVELSVDINESFNNTDKPSSEMWLEKDQTRTTSSSATLIDSSGKCEGKTPKTLSEEDILKLSPLISSEIVAEIPVCAEELNMSSPKTLLSDTSDTVEVKSELSHPKMADIEDPGRALSAYNEIKENTEEADKTDLWGGNESVEEHEKISDTTDLDEKEISSGHLSAAAKTNGAETEEISSLSEVESTLHSRPVSVVSEISDIFLQETLRREDESILNENSVRNSENIYEEIEKCVPGAPLNVTGRDVNEIDDNTNDICVDVSLPNPIDNNTNITVVSPKISTTDDVSNAESSENDLIKTTGNELEVTVKGASNSEIEYNKNDNVPCESVSNRQAAIAEKESFDNGLYSQEKEDTVPLSNEKLDDNTMEDSTTMDNDTEEVEKEDSTIASIPESIMTVPESMGDMELSSESSIGGQNEKSVEETKSEDIKPDEQDESSLTANFSDEPGADMVDNSSVSDDGDLKNSGIPEYKISKVVINGIEDENTHTNVYADAFGRPVPTINLIESEEQKRSDSEEENVERTSPEPREKIQGTEEKNNEILKKDDLAQDRTIVCVPGDEEGEESISLSVAGSDSINFHNREEGRSESATSQSRADSVVAEKGSEVDSITTLSAAPSADGARLMGEEEQGMNCKDPAMLHSPSTHDDVNEGEEATLNAAATTIQATFRGFQTRQTLQKISVSEPAVGSDGTDLPNRYDDKSESANSQSLVDSGTAEKGCEMGITSTDSPAPRVDVSQLVGEEEHELKSMCPAVMQSPITHAVVTDDEEALNAAATAIQATFRGFQTRQTLQKTGVSEYASDSDSIKLINADHDELVCADSQSRADSVVAQEGIEGDSNIPLRATAVSDGLHLVGEEVQKVSTKDPAVLQPSGTHNGVTEGEEAKYTAAATTIQATFRGFQTRQELHKSDHSTKVPREECLLVRASQETSENLDSPDTNVSKNDTENEATGGGISLETWRDSTLQDSAIQNSEAENSVDYVRGRIESLSSLQKQQKCDELPEHKEKFPRDGTENSSGDTDSSLSSAATKIQSNFRGYIVRKQVRDTMDSSTAISLTNEPSIPDSQQSFGTLSLSNEDNGVRTSGSLETAVQRQQQSTLDEVEELVGSGPTLLVDSKTFQGDDRSSPDDNVPTDTIVDQKIEADAAKQKEAIRGLSLDSKVDTATKGERPEVKSLSLQEKLTTDNEEDQKIWGTLEKELSDAATKIQSNYRGYRTRQKLTREDAVHMPTTSTSSATSVESDKPTDGEVKASGEFHDMMVLPPGEVFPVTNGEDVTNPPKA